MYLVVIQIKKHWSVVEEQCQDRNTLHVNVTLLIAKETH